MKLGTIVKAKYFNGLAEIDESRKYQELIKQNFSVVGMFAFGQMPFIAGRDANPENFDWKNTDRLAAFGLETGIEVMYNSVINSNENSFPRWYKELTPEMKVKALEDYVKAVVGRYKGKIGFFKLINEALRLPEEDLYGTGEKKVNLISKILSWAKEANPEGVYILNEHIPFLKTDELRQNLISLIKRIKATGTIIDYVGLEGHLGYRPTPFQLPSDIDISTTLDEVQQAAGNHIMITEFDLSYDNSPNKGYQGSSIEPSLIFEADGNKYINWFEYQAAAYKHFYEICLTKGYVEDLVFWGFCDDKRISQERPGTGLFDDDFLAKPVYKAMENIFRAKS